MAAASGNVTGTSTVPAAVLLSATTTCTPQSTTALGWPTPSCYPTNKVVTAAEFWTRARTWFAAQGIITIRRVLTDNGACYRSRVFAAALGDTTHKRTKPYRPQTNGKVERFNRTLLEEWAYARPYRSDQERCDAFLDWLHHYNHHRGHTALAGLPPAARVTNLSGQYS